MKLIVGLGNPGSNYAKTRHNIGFDILDYFACSLKWKGQHNSLVIKTSINNQIVLLVKPQQYMNLSGMEVAHFIRYYKIEKKDLLVIHDDMDLDIGKYKIKNNSSSGGHNGIKSIIENIGSQDFCRLKVGISKDKSAPDRDYVLGPFSKKQGNIIAALSPLFKDIITDFVLYNSTYIMNKYNSLGTIHENLN